MEESGWLPKNATRQDIQQKTWQMSRHWLRHYTTYDILENYCISQSFRWFPTFFWKSPFLCPKRRTFGDFGLKIPLFGFFTFLAILNNLKHFSAFKIFQNKYLMLHLMSWHMFFVVCFLLYFNVVTYVETFDSLGRPIHLFIFLMADS